MDSSKKLPRLSYLIIHNFLEFLGLAFIYLMFSCIILITTYVILSSTLGISLFKEKSVERPSMQILVLPQQPNHKYQELDNRIPLNSI